MIKRCDWAEKHELERVYHDEEWGVPQFDDGKLFEFVILESMQAGLSWLTILKKREAFRSALDGFAAERIAGYDDAKIDGLMENPAIIRNRKKLEAVRTNALAALRIKDEKGSLAAYFWDFVDGRPLQNAWQRMEDVPAESELSKCLAKDMKSRGFAFFGPVTCYAHMQAVGMVNDHLTSCFRYAEVAALAK
jgi:DNA-3-methyladenine glycosylase I